jgi:PHD/YefM family antitoxin component YafN of YafNO toxin-antitoxin module
MHVTSAPEIKRRGFGIIDGPLSDGPVCVIRNNRPAYVVMTMDSYREMEEAATLSRVEASERDLRDGRVARGSAADFMAALEEE